MIIRTLSATVVAFSLLTAVPTSAHADDAAKEALVRELLEVTGSADLGKQMMDGMMAQFQGNPALPPGFAEKFSELAKPEQIVEMVVPIYMKAYDEKTLQAAIDFYKTPEGTLLMAKMPQISQESMIVGQDWGAKLAQETLEALAVDATK